MSDTLSNDFQSNAGANESPFVIKDLITAGDLHSNRKSILDNIALHNDMYGVMLESQQIYLLPFDFANKLLKRAGSNVLLNSIGAKEFAKKITTTLNERLDDNHALCLTRNNSPVAVFIKKEVAEQLYAQPDNFSLQEKFKVVSPAVFEAIKLGKPIKMHVTADHFSIEINSPI